MFRNTQRVEWTCSEPQEDPILAFLGVSLSRWTRQSCRPHQSCSIIPWWAKKRPDEAKQKPKRERKRESERVAWTYGAKHKRKTQKDMGMRERKNGVRKFRAGEVDILRKLLRSNTHVWLLIYIPGIVMKGNGSRILGREKPSFSIINGETIWFLLADSLFLLRGVPHLLRCLCIMILNLDVQGGSGPRISWVEIHN